MITPFVEASFNSTGAVILQDDVHGVDTVRKIMGQDRDRHDDADALRGLKGKPDRHSVEYAVNAQHGRGEGGAARGIAVKGEDAVEHEVGQKAELGEAENLSRIMILLPDVDRLRKQVEEGDADHRAGAEAQNQMQFIAQRESQQAAGEGTRECRDGDDRQ